MKRIRYAIAGLAIGRDLEDMISSAVAKAIVHAFETATVSSLAALIMQNNSLEPKQKAQLLAILTAPNNRNPSYLQ